MDRKKRWGGLAVVAVVAVGTGAAAEPVKQAPPVARKAPAPTPLEKIQLNAGQSHDLSLQGMTRIAIGDPEVADIRVTGNVLHITALKKGETELWVWLGEGDKRVYTVSVGK